MGVMQQYRYGIRLVSVALGLFVAACLGAPVRAQALSWSTSVPVDSHGRPTSVSCPSRTLCATVDTNGHESTFAPDPSAPDAVSDLIDMGDPSDTACVSAGQCALESIACPSVAECVAVDVNGLEYTFDPRSPGAPRDAYIDPADNGGYSLNSVACPSTTRCTAVDSIAAQLMFNPLSPSGAKDVQVDTRNSSVELDSVACPSTRQCTAVDSQGYAVTFNPTSQKAFLKAVVIERGQFLNGVVCPATSQCTAVDRHGNEITFDPKSPHPHRASIDTYGLNGIACPSLRFCVAVDRHGRAVAGDPGHHWTTSRLSSSARLEAVACRSSSECVVVDSAGEVFIGQ